jgi:hypothetical protein
MREEWHVTVEGDQHAWRGFCTAIGIKPLRIELSTFEIQLMCAIPGTWVSEEYGAHVNPADAMVALHAEIDRKGFRVVRVKREVQVAAGETLADALYYECHIKIDGPFNPQAPMASRDLFRDHRWYLTRRELSPFDHEHWVTATHIALKTQPGAQIHSWEYECAIVDTHPELDSSWVRKFPANRRLQTGRITDKIVCYPEDPYGHH